MNTSLETPKSAQNLEIFPRITVDPAQCGERPCIRGMRIRVVDVLELLGAGLTTLEILDEMPDLELPDILASVQYAAHRRVAIHPINSCEIC